MSFRKLITALVLVILAVPVAAYAQVTNPQGGSIGIQGRLAAPPPDTPATITLPTSGQNFTELPITVQGLCPDGLLVKLFKNNVFSGSAQCDGGSYQIVTDLFVGQNELIARVYDALDQAGPDSNVVTVTYTDNRQGADSRPTLTSNFAKRGANPGQTLTWPIVLSGGVGPYAVQIDWGDGTTPDLMSQAFPGTFDISHVYDRPGVYNIIVRVTDQTGGTAFLQLVGIANGPLSQTSENPDDPDAGVTTRTQTRILWQPVAILLPLLVLAFWLGKKYELKVLRRRIEHGERPF